MVFRRLRKQNGKLTVAGFRETIISVITTADYGRLKRQNSYTDVGVGRVFTSESLSPLEAVKAQITERMRNFATSARCPMSNELDRFSRSLSHTAESRLKDIAFRRFIEGLSGWALRHVFEKSTAGDVEARRICLRSATLRKISYIQYEAKAEFVKWAAHAVLLYRTKLRWADISSYLDMMYIYARWAFSTCGPLLDDFVAMMSQLIRTTPSVANEPFVTSTNKATGLRVLGREILQKWSQALWKAALKNANHRVPEHRSGSFRQSVLESNNRVARGKNLPEPVDELDLYYGDVEEMSDFEDEEEM